MSNGSAAAALITTLDDDAWDDLLSFIEERHRARTARRSVCAHLIGAAERGP